MEASANRSTKNKYRAAGQRRKVYVPKGNPAAVQSEGTPAGSSSGPASPYKTPSCSLTRDFMLSLFSEQKETTLIPGWLKAIKTVYSEVPIVPECSKKFQLPMDKCVMPPRSEYQSGAKSYEDGGNDYYYANPGTEDKGIATHDEPEDIQGRVPLWFSSSSSSSAAASSAPGNGTRQTRAPDLSFEDMAKDQDSLEEEKRRFLAGSGMEEKARALEKECLYSSVDEKVARSLKAQSSGVDDIFLHGKDSAPAASENIQAVDMEMLETGLIKPGAPTSNNNNLEKDADPEEDVPVWNSFSAEEIQRHTREHMDGWGLSTGPALPPDPAVQVLNDKMENLGMDPPAEEDERDHPAKIMREDSDNPFCPDYLRISEGDKAWYYKDLQGLIRGPFSSSEMNMWLKAGYLPRDLQIRFGPESTFVPLESFLPADAMPPPATVPAPTPVPTYSVPMGQYAPMAFRPMMSFPQAYIVPSIMYPQQQTQFARMPFFAAPQRPTYYYPPTGPGANGRAGFG